MVISLGTGYKSVVDGHLGVLMPIAEGAHIYNPPLML